MDIPIQMRNIIFCTSKEALINLQTFNLIKKVIWNCKIEGEAKLNIKMIIGMLSEIE